jgi:hypothetical protein
VNDFSVRKQMYMPFWSSVRSLIVMSCTHTLESRLIWSNGVHFPILWSDLICMIKSDGCDQISPRTPTSLRAPHLISFFCVRSDFFLQIWNWALAPVLLLHPHILVHFLLVRI